MKKLFPLLIIFVLALTVMLPQQGLAETELEKINKQIAQNKQAAAAAQKKSREAEDKIKAIKAERIQTEKRLAEIYARMDEAEAEIARLEDEVSIAEEHLADTEQLIEEAIERIEARDDLLRKRMKFMYTNGSVSYLEVLFNATSFSDFLDRFNSLQSLVGQDKEILASNVRDHDIVVTKKGEIVGQLAHLADLYTEQEATLASLMDNEKEAEVMIASLNQDEQYQSELSEEQIRIAMEIVTANAKLEQEKKKIEAFYKGGALGYPFDTVYRITSNFGYRTHPVTGKKGTLHTGLDLGAPNGTKILAAEAGRVITAEELGGYGNTVVINHGGKDGELWTLYAHIRPNGIKVKVGQTVKKGDVIAEVGTTGTSTGYHLHFEVRLDGKAVDPKKYLNLK